MLEKFFVTTLELNWSQGLGRKRTKFNICHHVLTSTDCKKKIFSRRRKNENVCKMSKDEKCTCKACKNNVSLSNMQICGVFVAFVVEVA